MTSTNLCPLCGSNQTVAYDKGPLRRTFHHCLRCQLLFTAEENLPDRKDEKARYKTHNNSPDDAGYVEFLHQAVEPALKFLEPGMHGLDYGCGPGPAIATMLQARGIACENYDPFFFPEWKEGPFDFIFCTETFEHFFEPGVEMNKLDKLMKPGGFLVLMTSLWEEKEDFSNWAYARDETHVCFGHRKTMEYLERQLGWKIVFSDHDRVVIFEKD